MKYLFLVLWCNILLFPLISEASRGITVNLKVSEEKGAASAGDVQLYSNSYALVIGNDAYDHGWPPLSGAISDAEEVATALQQHGFEVILKKNLDSSSMKDAFEEFFVLRGEDPDARLFVWFAGHGHTLAGEGYLVPVDAPNPNLQTSTFKLKALSLRNFGTYVRQANAKHALSVFDSCFSGTVFESQRALPPTAITQATLKPVRQFLTSGDANQKVSDNGTFRKLFIRALNGEERSDANGDGYLTASELGLYITDRVTNITKARQTPKYGKLNDLQYDQGDFVFVLPNASGDPNSVMASPALAMIASPKILIQTEADLNIAIAKLTADILAMRLRINSNKKIEGDSLSQLFSIMERKSRVKRKLSLLRDAKFTSAMNRYDKMVESNYMDLAVAAWDHMKKVFPTRMKMWRVKKDFDIALSNIPPGRFVMGSKDREDELPLHKVKIDSFIMMQTEVTQKLWEQIMDDRPSEYEGDNRPVEEVSWEDIQVFIRALNKQSGYTFRLPSESEWEYAARAGAATDFATGECIKGAQANFNTGGDFKKCGEEDLDRDRETMPVASFEANAYGLYDMHGNVWEWTQDCWHSNYKNAPKDSKPWLISDGQCDDYVLRGGSWYNYAGDVRSSRRVAYDPSDSDERFGFRLVLE